MDARVEIHQSETSQAGRVMSDPISLGARGSITPKWDVGEHDPPSRAAFGGGDE